MNIPASGLRIPTKTFLIFVVVFLIVIVPVSYIAFIKVSDLVREADVRALQAEARRLIEQVRLDPITIPLNTTLPLRVLAGNELNMEEIFASPEFPSLDPSFAVIPLLQLDTIVVVTTTKFLDDGGQIMLSIASDSRDVQTRLTTVMWYLFAASIASIIVAAGLVFIVTTYTMQPIRRIIERSSNIKASGKMDRVPVPASRDESYELAEALNNMLERLEQSVRAQVNFFASAAHELRTPLTIMQTELGVALNATGDANTRKILESTLTEVQRLNRVVNDFLLISQLKSESLELRIKKTDLRELFYEAARKVRYLLQERGLTLEVKTDEEATLTPMDPDKMETVLVNLLNNASKYARADTTVKVQIRFSDSSCNFEMTNCIIDPLVNIDQLKGEFTKSVDLSSGLGMGLWICESVLRLHGSALHLSQTDGQFTAGFSIAVSDSGTWNPEPRNH